VLLFWHQPGYRLPARETEELVLRETRQPSLPANEIRRKEQQAEAAAAAGSRQQQQK